MKKVIKVVTVIICVVCMLNTLTYGQTKSERRYHMVLLPTLGGIAGAAYSINSKGDVVGYSTTPDGNYKPVIWSNGSIQEIPLMNDDYGGYATGINNKGQVAGYRVNKGKFYVSFLWSDGQMRDLGTMGANMSEPAAINNNGYIVGTISDFDHFFVHAFLWSDASVQDLGTLSGGLNLSQAMGINDGGEVVGYSYIANYQRRAFLWSNGSMLDLGVLGQNSDDTFSIAHSINNNSQIVGVSSDGNRFRAFLWSKGSMQDLGTLDGNSSAAFGINSHGEIVGVSSSNNSDVYHAFIYYDGSMKDLHNSLLETNSGWVVNSAKAINDSGQIIASAVNSLGQTHAVLLNPVLYAESITAIEKKPVQPVYGNVPVKEEGKDSLVVVTHGRIPPRDDPNVSTAWVDSMTTAIADYLNSSNINNWQVFGYKWIEAASTNVFRVIENAKQQGVKLGRQIVSQGYTNVHFIAHSAGAALIQSATDVIKNNNSSIVIHETFLDPYVGVTGSEAAVYGNRADWSDNYFTQDDGDTGFGNGLPFTQFIMPHTYNVDVTQLDLNKVKQDHFVTGSGTPCYKTKSKHGWPIDFYQNTIIGTATLDYQGYGFPLSKIGGNYANATANYLAGNGRVGNPVPLKELGVPDLKCFLDIPVPTYPSSPLDLFNSPAAQSTTGTIDKYPNGSIKAVTGSPVWLVTFVTVSNVANIVSFEADFQSTNNAATGLLSVYWDGDNIGSIDEQAVQDGLQRYSFKFPTASSDTMHGLGFRLDPFSDIQSVVVVTNVTVTASGVTEPFSLAMTGVTNGLQNYQLTGQAGFEYNVQATTNFIDWINIASLLNINGTVQFYDKSSTNNVRRFYRVVAPN